MHRLAYKIGGIMAKSDEEKEQVTAHYSTLSDEELKQLAGVAWSLTDAGREVLQTELTRRLLQVDLATVPPPEGPSSNLVVLCRFRDTPNALLAKGFLESSGLQSYLIDETVIRMDWLWSNALGGIKLCVKSEDAEEAAALLKKNIPDTISVEGIGEIEQPVCPQCNSLNISYADMNKRVAYASLLVLGFPISLKHGRWECQECGHQWSPVDGTKQES
jgi:hypothetical protein